MKSLEDIHVILKAAQAVIVDEELCSPKVGDLTGEDEHVFLSLNWVGPDMCHYSHKFNEGDNDILEVHNGEIIFTDIYLRNVHITPLKKSIDNPPAYPILLTWKRKLKSESTPRA